MTHRGAVLVVFGSLSLVTLMLLAGHGPWSGRVIWAVSGTHGLNSGDVVPLLAWLVGTVACVRLFIRSD